MDRGNLADLMAFIAVADHLSFRAAARRHAVGAQPLDAAARGGFVWMGTPHKIVTRRPA